MISDFKMITIAKMIIDGIVKIERGCPSGSVLHTVPCVVPTIPLAESIIVVPDPCLKLKSRMGVFVAKAGVLKPSVMTLAIPIVINLFIVFLHLGIS